MTIDQQFKKMSCAFTSNYRLIHQDFWGPRDFLKEFATEGRKLTLCDFVTAGCLGIPILGLRTLVDIPVFFIAARDALLAPWGRDSDTVIRLERSQQANKAQLSPSS